MVEKILTNPGEFKNEGQIATSREVIREEEGILVVPRMILVVVRSLIVE